MLVLNIWNRQMNSRSISLVFLSAWKCIGSHILSPIITRCRIFIAQLWTYQIEGGTKSSDCTALRRVQLEIQMTFGSTVFVIWWHNHQYSKLTSSIIIIRCRIFLITNTISRWRTFVCTCLLGNVLAPDLIDCSWNWNRCSRIHIIQWSQPQSNFPTLFNLPSRLSAA